MIAILLVSMGIVIPLIILVLRHAKRLPAAEGSVARSESMPWQPLNEQDVTGVFIKALRFDQATRRAPAMLLKFEPGASYPAHNHPGGEEVFVLEGEIRFGNVHLGKGDYLYTPPNHRHAVVSETGCVILANVPQEVERIDS